MKRKIIALCIAVIFLLTGCGADFSQGFLSALTKELLSEVLPPPTNTIIPYSDMSYTRPDMDAFAQSMERCRLEAERAASADALMEEIYFFYDLYDSFYTSYYLTDIRYSSDLTDSYWAEEYRFCSESITAVDAALDQLYRMLAASPMRETLEDEAYFGADFFDAYEGETMYDETYISLMAQESRLTSLYYSLSDQALGTEYYSEEYFATYGAAMAELFVELVALRQQIATYTGFPSYPDFAYLNYYSRDYTPQQATAYMEEIGRVLYEPYYRLESSGIWNEGLDYCSELDTLMYLKQVCEAMGGTPEEAFYLLEHGGLYDIRYNENKYNSSFELYLWAYREPFIFMCPQLDQQDKLTFAHEFGHFANDYICGGSYVGTDVAEVHSQAFEYLSLCYSPEDTQLLRYKMADSLRMYVECAAYALFEHQVYQLTGADLTVENVIALYESIGRRFGFDSWNWDPRDFVTVTHFYTNPMYMISYVVSNDLAFQFYQLEHAQSGAGLDLYEQCLTSQDSYIIAFAEEYGLVNPFSKGRIESVAETFKEILYIDNFISLTT